MRPDRDLGALVPRPAALDEAHQVADVWLRARRAAIPAIPPPVHSDAEVRAYFAAVVLRGSEVWVLDLESDGIVALLVLDDGWIDQLYVEPAWTGHGLGSRLIGLAKERRPQGLDLWTFQSNGRARRFYERHGFVAVATTASDNEEGAPDVRYRWPDPEGGAHPRE